MGFNSGFKGLKAKMGNFSVHCKFQHNNSSNWHEKRGQSAFTLVLTKTTGERRTGIVHSITVGVKGMFKE